MGTYGKLCMGCAEGLLTATDVLMAGPYAMGSNLIFPFCAGSIIFLDHVDKLDSSGMPAENFPILRKAKPHIFVTIPGTIQDLAWTLSVGDASLVEAMKPLKVITSAGAPLPPPAFCNMLYIAKQKGIKAAVLDGIGTS